MDMSQVEWQAKKEGRDGGPVAFKRMDHRSQASKSAH